MYFFRGKIANLCIIYKKTANKAIRLLCSLLTIHYHL